MAAEMAAAFVSIMPSMKGGMKNLAGEAKGAGKMLDGVLGGALKALLPLAAKLAPALYLGKSLAAGWKMASAMDAIGGQLRVINGETEGVTKNTELFMAAVESIAGTSTISKGVLGQTAVALSSVGVEAGRSQGLMTALGDAVLGCQDGFQMLTTAFKTASQGAALNTMQMQALQRRGFDPTLILTQAVAEGFDGVTESQIKNLSNSQKLLLAIEALEGGYSNMAGAMDYIAGSTLEGSLSRLTNAHTTLWQIITKGAIPGVLNLTNGLFRGVSAAQTMAKESEGLQQIFTLFERVTNRVGNVLETVVTVAFERVFHVIGHVGGALELLTTVFDAAGGGLAGFGAVGRELADIFLEGLTNIVTRIPEIITRVTSFISGGGLAGMISGFGKAGSTAGEGFFGGALPALMDAVKELGAWFVSDGFEMIARAFVSKQTQKIELGTKLFGGLVSGLSAVIPALVAAIPTLVSKVTGVITQSVPVIVRASLTLFSGLVSGLMTALPVLLDAVVTVIQQVLPKIVGLLPELVNAAIELFNGLVDGVLNILPDLIESVMDAIGSVIETVLDQLPDLLDAAITLFTALVDAAPKIITDLLSNVAQIIDRVLTAVMDALPDLLRAAVSLFSEIVRSIPIMIRDLVRELPTIITTILNSVLNALPELLSAAVLLFTEIISAIPQILPELIAAIPAIISAIVETLHAAIPMMLEAGKNLMRGVIDGIKSMIGAAKDAVGGVLSSIRNLLPFSPAKEGPFSGKGWTLYSGRAIIEDMARGIRQRSNLLRDAMDDALQYEIGDYRLALSGGGQLNLNELVSRFEVACQLASAGIVDMHARDLATRRGAVWEGTF